MREIEQTLESREVAEMVEKEHSKLLKDIRRYTEQFNEAKIGFVEFFKESAYKDAKGETRPCYRITKKGCEFIAHKLTGTKGTIFTARYINRFHEMQDMLSNLEPKFPWFIRKFKGRYIVLFRDFRTITGVDVENHKLKNWGRLVGGRDFNGTGWRNNNEEFKQKYGFDYGDADCMMYFYLGGIPKVLEMIKEDGKVHMISGAYETLMDGVNMVKKSEVKKKENLTVKSKPLIQNQEITQTGKYQGKPIQITITLNDNIGNIV